MTKPKTDTYEVTFRGRKTRVTIPPKDEVGYCGEPSEVLRDVLRDNLSPRSAAVLANAIRLQLNGKLTDHDVRKQLAYLAAVLMVMIGPRYARLCREAGL